MKSRNFLYEQQEIAFLRSEKNIMVNATQMAKVFNKRIDFFLKSDNTKAFIKELEFTSYGGNSELLKRDEILKTRGSSGTYMHRILALKFAAWLNPKLELWVFTTIDKIIYAHFQNLENATIEKLKAERNKEQMLEELLRKHPKDFNKFLELDGKLTKADRKRIEAIKASTQELKLNLFSQDDN